MQVLELQCYIHGKCIYVITKYPAIISDLYRYLVGQVPIDRDRDSRLQLDF